MTYEKEKRKNDDERGSLIGWIMGGLWHYGVVLPVKGSWWLTKHAARIGWDMSVWAVNAPMRLWYAVMGLPPQFETQRETNAYRMIRRRYRRRNFFMLHTMFYVLGMLAATTIVIDLFNNGANPGRSSYIYQQALSFIVTAIVWTTVWTFHLIQKRSGDSEDRELREALEREYERQQRSVETPVYEDYYRERLAIDEVEYSDNHSAAYYEDNTHRKPARKR